MKPEWTGLKKLLVANAINKAKAPETYITDGLVLWMDGIDKGGTAGAWTDVAAGHVFTSVNGFTDGSNYVGLDAASSQYLYNSTFTAPSRFDGTVEAVITDFARGNMFFFPKTAGQIAFSTSGSTDKIIWSTGGDMRPVPYDSTSKMFSITSDENNDTIAVVNGVHNEIKYDNAYWSGPDNTYNYIGRRNYSTNYNYVTAKIHAIRIYNRRLTPDEMLHNQRIDNKRFNLGLTI